MCVFVVVLFWIPWTDVTLIWRNMALMIACFLWTICDWARQHVHSIRSWLSSLAATLSRWSFSSARARCLQWFRPLMTMLISKTVLMCFVILHWFELIRFSVNNPVQQSLVAVLVLTQLDHGCTACSPSSMPERGVSTIQLQVKCDVNKHISQWLAVLVCCCLVDTALTSNPRQSM